MRFIGLAVLTLLCLLLPSCIEGDEEIFLNADGSARLKAVYKVPALIFSDKDAAEMHSKIAKEIGEEDKVNLLTNTVERINGQQVITIEVETGDLVKLEDVMEQSSKSDNKKDSKSEQALDALLGQFIFRREGLNVGINRKVDLAPLLEQYLGERGASMLGTSEFRYTIHFPEAVKSSNAHEVLDGGKTLKWRYKLSECAERPIELNIVTPLPLPWWVYTVVGAVSLLMVVVVYRVVSRIWARRPNVVAT